MIRGRPQDPFVVIPVNDEAIDRETLDGQVALRTYIRERDPDVLRLLVGGQPTRFRCKPLAHQARLAIEGQEYASVRHTLAFHMSVESAENLILPNGQPWIPRRSPAGWDRDATMLSDESVKELGDAGLGKVVEEIGYVCLQRANLSPSQKKAFRLPLGFTVSWESSTSATSPKPSEPQDPSTGST